MKIKSMLAILFFVMLTGGLATFANAQTNPNENAKPNHVQKDDGEDEEVTAKDREKIKITVEQARKTALERVSGTIIEEEIEKENGKIVYSIEVKEANGKVFDVEVDAETGVIVKVEQEDEDDEDDDKKTNEKPPQQKF